MGTEEQNRHIVEVSLAGEPEPGVSFRASAARGRRESAGRRSTAAVDCDDRLICGGCDAQPNLWHHDTARSCSTLSARSFYTPTASDAVLALLVFVGAFVNVSAQDAGEVGRAAIDLITRLPIAGVFVLAIGSAALYWHRRHSLAVLGVNLFVSILAATIKASVENTVTQTFPTVDLTLRSANGADSNAPETFTSTFTGDLRRLPEIGAVSAMRFGKARVDGEVVDVTAIETKTITSLYDVKPSTGTLKVIADGGLLIAEKTLQDRGFAVGDAIQVEFAATGVMTMVVNGTFPDEDFGEYLISMPTYETNYLFDQDGFLLASYAPGVDDVAGRAAVDRLAADYAAVSVQNEAQFIADAKRSIDQLLALFWGLLGIAIVIAVMGITNTPALSIAERTREVGLLRAAGMSRRQVRSMIRWEAVIISLFGAVLGLGLGVFFGWSITTALSDEGLGGFTVPVAQLVTYFVIAGLAGVLAALWPARSAARMNVLRAIGHE